MDHQPTPHLTIADIEAALAKAGQGTDTRTGKPPVMNDIRKERCRIATERYIVSARGLSARTKAKVDIDKRLRANQKRIERFRTELSQWMERAEQEGADFVPDDDNPW